MTSRISYNDPKNVGGFSLAYHREMLSDMKRLTPLLRAIEENCKDKVVFESGTGTGVLSIMAARAGARAVFCSEIDPAIAAFAKENIANSGCADRITLIEGSTLDVTLADLGGRRPEVLVAENLSTWQVTEPQNQVMNYLRTNLAQPGEVAGDEDDEAEQAQDGDHRSGERVEALHVEIGQRQEVHRMQRLGKEQANQEEGRADAKRQDGAVPEPQQHGALGVVVGSAKFQRLAAQRQDQDPGRNYVAGNEVITDAALHSPRRI